ncbi:dCTP deaminase [Candidatus Micrarchaeota archaeon]|nr:dCTP deaminase [Candidatus Micrarchaeota archaeon]
MTLSNLDIKVLIKKGAMRIAPLEEGQISSASVDLTLSEEWWLFKKKYIGKKVDLSKVDFKEATEKFTAEKIILKPGEMCLGRTVEKITLPPYIMGKLEGRSRYARMGLSVHITSAVVQPGSDNHQILEIVNFAPFSVILHKGMRISQVIFHRLENPTTMPYSKFGKIGRKQ